MKLKFHEYSAGLIWYKSPERGKDHISSQVSHILGMDFLKIHLSHVAKKIQIIYE